MKDNLNQVVEYSIEAPNVEVAERRTATVTGYNPDGTLVFLKDADGVERHLPVGTFMVHKILGDVPGKDQLVAAGLAPEPAPPVPAGQAAGDSRRLSVPDVSTETRRRMGGKPPPKDRPDAAGPDEFAEPK